MSEFILSAFADEAAVNLDDQITTLKETEISFIEMRSIDGNSLIDCSNQKILEIKENLKANNIRLSSVGSYIGKIKITDDFKPHLDKFKRAVEIALMLNSPFIRIFSFYIPQNEDHLIYRDEVMERMTAILDETKGSTVFCAHENEKDIYGDIPSRVFDLHQTLGERLKGIFDPANYIQCNVTNVIDAMQLLYPYIEYMHIKDSRLLDGAVVPAGFGDGKIAELIELFFKKDGQRFLTIEPHLSVFAGYDKLGDNHSIKNDFVYDSTKVAFLDGVEATKNILLNLGFKGDRLIWKK
jgi:sugar phosphate isomerase/epimerase